jgi:nucleoside phosphorylase
MNLEYKAMRAQLVALQQEWHPEGTSFEVGTVPGAPWRVAMVLTGEGNANAAVLAERAIARFSPRALLVVGIAGALKDDVELGDVVVATWVHGYHGGKDDDAGFRARPRGWGAAHQLEQVARMVDVREEWADLLPWPAKPAVHFKPIAAGEVVLNSRSSALAVQLREHYDDAAAIEMESAGAGAAAHLNASLPVLTIRGISDKADGEKHLSDTAGFQPLAASHAAVFAAAFLRELAGSEPPDTDAVAG